MIRICGDRVSVTCTEWRDRWKVSQPLAKVAERAAKVLGEDDEGLTVEQDQYANLH